MIQRRHRKIERLPEPIRAELDRQLRGNGYCRVRRIADWLAREGYPLTSSTVQRYAKDSQREALALERLRRETPAVETALQALGRVHRDTCRLRARLAEQDAPAGADLLELGRLSLREGELLEQLRRIQPEEAKP